MKTVKLPLEVKVTRHDIETGDRVDPTTCPTAKAIRRTTGIRRVYAYRDDVIINDRKFAMPPTARTFIRLFDHSSTIHPHHLPEFTFVITKELTLTDEERDFLGRL